MSIEPVILAPGADPMGEVPDELQLDPVPLPTDYSARQERYRRVFALGFHPVGNPHRLSLPKHPDAPPLADKAAPGPRCGDCRFWVLLSGHKHHKCTRAPHGYTKPTYRPGSMSRGRGMNVPEWWPACADFEPGPAPETQAQDDDGADGVDTVHGHDSAGTVTSSAA